ncbi:MAG: DUF3078 domain-containing protein [Tannerella sp.]|jgi:hypothetical protein|nr:DUF3078 domain-containing protein [Tannerella sp.]
MKKIIVLFAGFATFINVYAQEATRMAGDITGYDRKDTTLGWTHSGITSLSFGQTTLQNWAAGGNNTVSGNFVFNFSLNYLSEKFFWDNNLASEFGMIYSSSADWQKATDKLNLNAIGGRRISKSWSVAALLNFHTQLAKGYEYPDKSYYISALMSPGYLDAALGLSYKPNQKYALFISPLAERVTIVLDDSLSHIGAFGIEAGKKTRLETGAYLSASTNQNLATDLSLISSLELFTPYTGDFGNVNVNWNLLLNYKFSHVFSATLTTTLRYYEKEIAKVQFKEILGLGVTYAF